MKKALGLESALGGPAWKALGSGKLWEALGTLERSFGEILLYIQTPDQQPKRPSMLYFLRGGIFIHSPFLFTRQNFRIFKPRFLINI